MFHWMPMRLGKNSWIPPGNWVSTCWFCTSKILTSWFTFPAEWSPRTFTKFLLLPATPTVGSQPYWVPTTAQVICLKSQLKVTPSWKPAQRAGSWTFSSWTACDVLAWTLMQGLLRKLALWSWFKFDSKPLPTFVSELPKKLTHSRFGLLLNKFPFSDVIRLFERLKTCKLGNDCKSSAVITVNRPPFHWIPTKLGKKSSTPLGNRLSRCSFWTSKILTSSLLLPARCSPVTSMTEVAFKSPTVGSHPYCVPVTAQVISLKSQWKLVPWAKEIEANRTINELISGDL